MRILRCHVRKNGDYTQTAECKERYDLIVVSGIEINLSIRHFHQLFNL